MEVDPLTLRRRQHPDRRIGERVGSPSGSSKIVVWSQRSEQMNPNEPDTSKRTPRTREASVPALRANAKDILNQLQEDRKRPIWTIYRAA